MSTLKRALIKSYNAGTHKATVQVAGSLAVWLADVPVSIGIASADVIIGAECGVIFFTDDNPNDAAVITIHNAGPPAAGGGTPVRIIDADADTEVDTENAADEDKIRMTIAGTLRYLMQAASPHHDLTGDVKITSGALGVRVAPDTFARFATMRDAASVIDQYGVIIDIGLSSSAPTGDLIALGGRAIGRSASLAGVYGLKYIAGNIQGGWRLPDGQGVQAAVFCGGGGLIDGTAFEAYDVTTIGGNITNVRGFRARTLTPAAQTLIAPFCDDGTAENANKVANIFKTATQLFSLTISLGGGKGVLGIADASVAPTTNPAGGGVAYSEAGALKWRSPNGVVTTMAAA